MYESGAGPFEPRGVISVRAERACSTRRSSRSRSSGERRATRRLSDSAASGGRNSVMP